MTMVNSVTGTTATTTTTSADTSMKKDLGLDSNDFLKLFVAQLQNQDPLSPQDSSQMLTQLAQIAQVQQAYNTNTNLTSLLTAQNNSTAMDATSLIGKTVKANGSTAAFDGTNSSTLQFNLSVPTAVTTVTITNAAGNTVRTVSLGAQSAGDATYAWDGKDSNGTTVSAGAYTFAVSGTTAAGAAATATTYTAGRVDGVSYNDSGTATLTIGAASVALPDVISVGT